MKLDLPKDVTLEEIEEWAGGEVTVKSRKHISSHLEPYYCSIKGLETKDRTMLVGTSGDGQTIEEAIKDYCAKLSHKELVCGAFTSDRKELITGVVKPMEEQQK